MFVKGDYGKPKESILSIIGLLGKADMIVPYFGDQDNRSFLRSKLSAVFTVLINIISGHYIKYYNGPVLHLRYNVMRWSPDTYGFAYQAELITEQIRQKKTYIEIEIAQYLSSGTSESLALGSIPSVIGSIVSIFFNQIIHIVKKILKIK